MKDSKEITIVHKSALYRGFFSLSEYALNHTLFDGGRSETFKRLLFERGNAACVLLWDPDRDCCVMVEQFRIGALEHPHSPWLIELVAGMVEPGELPHEVVRREAREEANMLIKRLHAVGSYLTSPGASSERVWLFIGEVDSSNAGGIHGLSEEHENIRVQVQPRTELMAEIWQGRADNAATIISLQWLALNRDELLGSGGCEPSGVTPV